MKNVTLFKSWLLLALVMLTGNAMAQTVLLYEDFSKCTSTAPDNPSGSASDMDALTSVPGWTVVKGNVGEGNMKFGTSSAAGSITTPALDLSDENSTYTLSFKACAWSGDKNILKVSVDDQDAVEVAGLTNAAAPYAANMKEFSLNVKGTAESKITIAAYQASKARFFIDDIKVVKLSAGETAAPSVKAPSVVAFGSVKAGSSVTSVVEVVGADLTDDLTVSVAGEGFSCETATIAKDEAGAATLNVVFSSVEIGEFAGTLTISGGGLSEAVVINLTAATVATAGSGTKEDPYTVADVILLNNPKTSSWVKGVIVGYVNGASLSAGAVFNAENASTSNILIADAADVTDATLCVPIQLVANTDVRAGLNLVDNAANLGKELLICGSLEAYFSVAGIKAPSEYVLGEGGGIDPTPVETYSYTKATSVESGKAYLVVAEVDGAYKVATPLTSKDYGYLNVADATIEDGKLTLKTKANEFVFTSTDNGYIIMASDARYLYQSGTYNSFNVAAEPEDGQVWTVDANEDGTFKITNNAVNKYFQYSSQYSSFGSYADEQGVMPCLYELYTGAGDGIVAVEAAAGNAPVEVYTLGGVKVGTSLEGLAKGIYVVKQGNTVKKVIK